MLPENSPLVGNLEKWFSDSLSDRHLRVGDTCWVQCAKAREGGLFCALGWMSAGGGETHRGVSARGMTGHVRICARGAHWQLYSGYRDGDACGHYPAGIEWWVDSVTRVRHSAGTAFCGNSSAVDGDLYRILMATSSRLVALPGVLRRSLSKVIQMSGWEILSLTIKKETSLKKNIGKKIFFSTGDVTCVWSLKATKWTLGEKGPKMRY